MRTLTLKNQENKCDSFTYYNDGRVDVTNDKNKDLFSLGRSTFFRHAFCSLLYNCKTKKFNYECDIHYFIRDWFRDPLDIGIETGGRPYRINADWYSIKTGSGSFK